jgi:transcriptional regulator with XRE-family HTH domain
MKPMPKTEEFILAQAALGKRITTLRKRNKLSQPAFASLCKLHPSFLSRIEGGKANPNLATLITIARALGMTLSDLFAGIPMVGPLTSKKVPNNGALIRPSSPPPNAPATLNDPCITLTTKAEADGIETEES